MIRLLVITPFLVLCGLLMIKSSAPKILMLSVLAGGISGAIIQGIYPGHAHVPFSEYFWIGLCVLVALLSSCIALTIRHIYTNQSKRVSQESCK
jgi:hypothetical protein